MSRCIALVPSSASALVWDRCARTALRGDRFCADHRRSLDGAVMGFLDTKDYRHAQEQFRNEAFGKSIRRRKQKSRAPSRAAATRAKTQAKTQTKRQTKVRADLKTLRRLGKKVRASGAALADFLGT
jgi:sRNA-binding protein